MLTTSELMSCKLQPVRLVRCELPLSWRIFSIYGAPVCPLGRNWRATDMTVQTGESEKSYFTVVAQPTINVNCGNFELF